MYWLRYWVVHSVFNTFFGCFLYFLFVLPLFRFILDVSWATDNINLVYFFFFYEWSSCYLDLFVLCFAQIILRSYRPRNFTIVSFFPIATTNFFLTFSVLFSSHTKWQFQFHLILSTLNSFGHCTVLISTFYTYIHVSCLLLCCT